MKKPITKFVNGPINATLPNLLLSDNTIITTPGAMNLNDHRESRYYFTYVSDNMVLDFDSGIMI
jgi:hypothetical protein